jgi:hypothetical protein
VFQVCSSTWAGGGHGAQRSTLIACGSVL